MKADAINSDMHKNDAKADTRTSSNNSEPTISSKSEDNGIANTDIQSEAPGEDPTRSSTQQERATSNDQEATPANDTETNADKDSDCNQNKDDTSSQTAASKLLTLYIQITYVHSYHAWT